MLSIPASRPNAYTGSPLDRVSGRRDEADFVAAQLAREDALFVPVWRSQSLLRDNAAGEPEAVLLTPVTAEALRMTAGPAPAPPGLAPHGPAPWVLLGLFEEGPLKGRPVFAVDCSAAEDPLPLLSPEMGRFADLRPVAALMPPGEASLLAHARGMLHWRSRHRFCGVCGGVCEPRAAGNTLRCANCGTMHFPRTDPAVIMLILRGDRCLLANSPRFPDTTMYSTLAGFVEPGESLEEAVRREVLEEAGIRVGEVHYHSSQPWPFPASVMIGFHGEALSDAITIDPDEIRDARWFSRDELRSIDTLGLRLPRADSIARRLIEDWLENT